VISSSRRPLADNTQLSQQTKIMSPAGFEPTIPVSELPQTHALDCAATGTGIVFIIGAHWICKSQYQVLINNPAVSFLCSRRSIRMYIHLSFFFSLRHNPLWICIHSPLAGFSLLFRGFLITHNDATHSVGLLWTSDQFVAENSTWQHTTLTTDKRPWPEWYSNPQSQQARGRRPTP